MNRNKKIRVLHFDKIYSISISELWKWYIFHMNMDENNHNTLSDRQHTFSYTIGNRFKELKEKPISGISRSMSNYDVNFLDVSIDDSIDLMGRLVSVYLSIYNLQSMFKNEQKC